MSMNKTIIKVPRDIRYLSQWNEFNLPDHPCIINKQITGCGFTEWCITSNLPVILCSPRRVLLTNKESQHSGEVYYARNEYEKIVGVDIDLLSQKSSSIKKTDIDIEKSKESVKLFEEGVLKAITSFSMKGIAPKILVTYDSFRLLSEILKKHGLFSMFHVVVDEMQSIFMDSRFKANVEMEFINILRGIQKLCFVSATPMMEEYLDMLDEFKDLPYYELDWRIENPYRVEIPNIIPIPYRGSLVSIASDIINDYKNGNYEKDTKIDNYGNLIEIESKEVVFFVNSVKNICDIIKKCDLTIDNTDVICSDTETNKERVRQAFKIKNKSLFTRENLTHIPKWNEPRKMFTLCTKTAYLGADFYSDNARTIILSDGNVECLAVDISLDLPQILGRQRNFNNPWKNYAELYFKSGMGTHDISEEEFNKLIEKKLEETRKLLKLYEQSDPDLRDSLVKKCISDLQLHHYKDDYIGINKHSGSSKTIAFNALVMVSEKRAFDIQRKDYFSRFTVLSEIEKQFRIGTGNDIITVLENFVISFNRLQKFTDKMKYLCGSIQLFPELAEKILKVVPKEYKNFYLKLGPDRLSALSYQRSKILSELGKVVSIQEGSELLLNLVYSRFQEGDRISRAKLKEELNNIYDQAGIDNVKKIQASTIEEFFEVERTRVTNEVTKKREEGFRLIKRKEV